MAPCRILRIAGCSALGSRIGMASPASSERALGARRTCPRHGFSVARIKYRATQSEMQHYAAECVARRQKPPFPARVLSYEPCCGAVTKVTCVSRR
jgi:hypothetical protein